MKFEKLNVIYVLSFILFAKLILIGVSLTDCLGALVLLSAILLDSVVKHIYPKRVDLFKELSLIQSTQVEVISKFEDLERDVTALKFGQVKR